MITGKFVATASRYWLSGSLTTLTHFAIFIFAIDYYALDPVLATALGFCISTIINYPLQIFWTFQEKKPYRQFFLRYLGIGLVNLTINNEVFWLANTLLNSNYLIAQLVASSVIIFFNALFNHYYIFVHHRFSKDENVTDKILLSGKFITTFVRYFCGGGIAVIIQFATLILFIEHFSVKPLIATTISFILAVIFNYTIQFYWTFKVNGPHQHFLTRYLIVTFLTLAINNGLFWFTFTFLYFPYWLAQIFATGTVFLINFFINHYYTFKAHTRMTNNA